MDISVAITNPADGAAFPAGTNITLQAAASAAGSAISKVEFYANTNVFIGVGSNSSFSVVWNNAPAGNWTLTAAATDTNGYSVSSAAVNISVMTGGFAVTASPLSQTVIQGAGTTFTVTVATNSAFTGSVTFGVSGLPSGANGIFTSPSLGGSGNSTLNVSTAPSAPPGNHSLLISGVGEGVTNTATVSLNISAAPVTAYWTNTITATAQNWNVNANWTNATAFPNTSDELTVINAGLAAPQTIALNQPVTIGSLQIGDANGLAGYIIAANGGSLTFSGTNTATLTQLASSAGDVLAAPVAIATNFMVINNSTNPLTLAGNLSGSRQRRRVAGRRQADIERHEHVHRQFCHHQRQHADDWRRGTIGRFQLSTRHRRGDNCECRHFELQQFRRADKLRADFRDRLLDSEWPRHADVEQRRNFHRRDHCQRRQCPRLAGRTVGTAAFTKAAA